MHIDIIIVMYECTYIVILIVLCTSPENKIVCPKLYNIFLVLIVESRNNKHFEISTQMYYIFLSQYN